MRHFSIARCFHSKGLLSGEEFRKPNPRFQTSGLRWRLRRTDLAFPSRGRCPIGADRALAAGKTAEKSRKVRGTWGSVSPSPRMTKISHYARNDDTGV